MLWSASIPRSTLTNHSDAARRNPVTPSANLAWLIHLLIINGFRYSSRRHEALNSIPEGKCALSIAVFRCVVVGRSRQLNLVLCLFSPLQFVRPLLGERIPICQLQPQPIAQSRAKYGGSFLHADHFCPFYYPRNA